MEAVIMRKDDPITIAQFSDDGNLLRYSQNIINPELAPLHERMSSDWLRKWWKDRSVPISQGKVAAMLERKGLLGSEDYLVKNMGLSLTDYYWIKPIGSRLSWKEVNLYENEFHDDILSVQEWEEQKEISSYTPNSTLQGQLEKTWRINDTGERILVKGNRDHLSTESINEVIAAKLHELQGYDNYTPYYLLKIQGKQYDYGCYAKAFTNLERELVSAYAVVTSEKKKRDRSSYEHFLSVCVNQGIDGERLRADLEYQIMTDFILSGRDRHLNNISVLRDAHTLKFLRMAPIYDSGKCLFVQDSVPLEEKELLNVRTNSFASSELKLLTYVTDRSLVDVSKLPSPEWIRDLYYMDSQMNKRRIEQVRKSYEWKVDKFRDFQLGRDLHKIVVRV